MKTPLSTGSERKRGGGGKEKKEKKQITPRVGTLTYCPPTRKMKLSGRERRGKEEGKKRG